MIYRQKNLLFILPLIHQPKWWIGAAGETATHAVVFAQLLLPDPDAKRSNNNESKKIEKLKNYGVHNFIVPLRDMETHQALKGVYIGDLGQKQGLNGIDNGWIQFDSVRIPHDHMLCRYSGVDFEKGFYLPPPRKEMAYGALIGTRAQLITTACNFQKKALMIVIRYTVMRVQGTVDDNNNNNTKNNGKKMMEEVKILDHTIHMRTLMTLLAACYAWHFQATFVEKLNTALEDKLDIGDLSILKDVHGTMAGLKAFSTWHTYDMD